VYYLFINNKNLFFLINFYPVKNFATFFQKHRKALPSNVLEMGVAPNSAKMRFRPQGGIAFLPPDFPQPYSFSNSNKATCKVYEPCRLLKIIIKVIYSLPPELLTILRDSPITSLDS